ncbi:MAG TPA: 3-hydroxybutyryl-CoA dehydrogenase [Terriglobia bacterium]|nr:3-hydroxybutyryl-CoA dehydrogenase [Terriglobia bacterium]
MAQIQNFGIVGAGTMGNGIAHVAARAGYSVILCDVATQALDRARATIEKNMDREIARSKLTAGDKSSALARIVTTTDPAQLSKADFIVEAVIEDTDAKLKIFQSLDSIARPGVILASNTSSIAITKIAAATKRPGNIIGMHFMNPVPVMNLVEIVRGLSTSDETHRTTEQLTVSLGKTPVTVNDSPGFVSNRVLMPMINEAIYCVMEGVSSAESVDQVMKLGMNHPIGPLALADMIGLDVCLYTMEVLHQGFGDSKYRPCPLLRRMVDAGHVGRKSGQGFYKY